MLTRGRVVPFSGIPLLLLLFTVWWLNHEPSTWTILKETYQASTPLSRPSPQSNQAPSTVDNPQAPLPGQISKISPELLPHRELFSLSTPDKKYFLIQFGNKEAINPSILPHPHNPDTYIIVAQQQLSKVNNTVWFTELVCDAKFADNILSCIDSPTILPIAATYGGNCKGPLTFFNFNIGPHDARAFYGPNGAYVVYGSNSKYTCFGQWMQDLRVLTDWGNTFVNEDFRTGVEIKRHKPWGEVEKNWFVFWDKKGDLYVHWDIQPRRSFARLYPSGEIGPDLARHAKTDGKCMAMYMPPTGPYMEDNHQATNSLSITTCNRKDLNCIPNDENTFILSIFHFKSYHLFHGVYEPYVLLMRQAPPFSLHAIGSKPLWIHGRGKAGEGPQPADFNGTTWGRPWNQSEMIFVTSISWKRFGGRYHGYADDVLFLGFGVEDTVTAGMDIMAGELLVDLGLCEDARLVGGIA